jgi:hypothetical protein
MKKPGKQLTRKHGAHLRVPVLPEEKAAIEQQAHAAGMSVAAYLRALGLGYEIRGILDYQRVDDLAKASADLGRMGGLLKLWLTNDERIMKFGQVRVRSMILRLLDKIGQNQDELRTIIKTIVAR